MKWSAVFSKHFILQCNKVLCSWMQASCVNSNPYLLYYLSVGFQVPSYLLSSHSESQCQAQGQNRRNTAATDSSSRADLRPPTSCLWNSLVKPAFRIQACQAESQPDFRVVLHWTLGSGWGPSGGELSAQIFQFLGSSFRLEEPGPSRPSLGVGILCCLKYAMWWCGC